MAVANFAKSLMPPWAKDWVFFFAFASFCS
jgi:hypothetical protein